MLKRRLLLFILIPAILVGCQLGTGTPTPDAAATPTLDIYNLPTTPPQLPTAATGQVVLAAAPDSIVVVEALPGLTELANERGWLASARADLTPEQVTSDIRVVIFPTPPENLESFVNAAPGTQFVVLDQNVQVQTGANLSVITLSREQQAFLAGVVAVMVAPDWRAVGILPAEPPPGDKLEAAFRNGGGYVCGTCVPFYAPYIKLPYPVRLAPGSEANLAADLITQFQQSYLKLVYVSPEFTAPEFLQAFSDANFILVGAQTPPDSVRIRWAGSVRFDWVAGLKDIWPAVSSGQGAQATVAPLMITDVNEAYLTPGRLAFIEQINDTLQEGLIAILPIE